MDRDLLELGTAAPTLRAEGLAAAWQVLATKKWDLCIGDVEAAFLRGEGIERRKGRVLVRVPPGGIPGSLKEQLSNFSKQSTCKRAEGLAQVIYQGIGQHGLCCVEA